ncbi:MAG: hypothetical protein CMI67_21805 [Pelagibaca sp.]|nr:hypothetical protein [Pelagibaca sp.]
MEVHQTNLIQVTYQTRKKMTAINAKLVKMGMSSRIKVRTILNAQIKKIRSVLFVLMVDVNGQIVMRQLQRLTLDSNTLPFLKL